MLELVTIITMGALIGLIKRCDFKKRAADCFETYAWKISLEFWVSFHKPVNLIYNSLLKYIRK